MEKIIIVGDTHGNWSSLNTMIMREKPDIILHTGDFGWWPKFHNTTAIRDDVNPRKKWNQYGIKNGDCKIYFCDGNHEDHWDLKKYEKQTELMPNVFYMPRGSILTLPDSRNVLFMGGATSIDKNVRTIGIDWFPEEEISQKNIFNLPECKVDIVISHTCPTKIRGHHEFSMFKEKESSGDALDFILEKYHPLLWFFGHFHFFQVGYIEGVKWRCLNIMGFTRGWIELDPKD